MAKIIDVSDMMDNLIDVSDITNRLRPCPFCGSNHVELKRHSIRALGDSRKHWWYVICNNCGIKLENITDDSMQNTVNSWNVRKNVADEAEGAKMGQKVQK